MHTAETRIRYDKFLSHPLGLMHQLDELQKHHDHFQ